METTQGQVQSSSTFSAFFVVLFDASVISVALGPGGAVVAGVAVGFTDDESGPSSQGVQSSSASRVRPPVVSFTVSIIVQVVFLAFRSVLWVPVIIFC